LGAKYHVLGIFAENRARGGRRPRGVGLPEAPEGDRDGGVLAEETQGRGERDRWPRGPPARKAGFTRGGRRGKGEGWSGKGSGAGGGRERPDAKIKRRLGS